MRFIGKIETTDASAKNNTNTGTAFTLPPYSQGRALVLETDQPVYAEMGSGPEFATSADTGVLVTGRAVFPLENIDGQVISVIRASGSDATIKVRASMIGISDFQIVNNVTAAKGDKGDPGDPGTSGVSVSGRVESGSLAGGVGVASVNSSGFGQYAVQTLAPIDNAAIHAQAENAAGQGRYATVRRDSSMQFTVYLYDNTGNPTNDANFSFTVSPY